MEGVITAKYFWFSRTVSVATIFAPFFISQKRKIHITDFLFGILAIYICLNYWYLNNHSNMQWWITLLMLPLYVSIRSVARNEKLRDLFLFAILMVVLVESVWGLLQLYGFMRSYHSLYKITGTLFNPGPYSGFIATGIPLALGFSIDKSLPRWKRWPGIATLTVSILVLPATMSRAAWIAALVGCIPILWKWFQVTGLMDRFRIFKILSPMATRAVLLTAGGLLTMVLLVGVYFMKKDSADGRWVIWSASMKVVKEYTLFGVGYGSFSAVYGDTQAAYFLEKDRSSAQIMVADSPDYAFNEYVQIAVELGIVGLALFVLLLCSIFYSRNSILNSSLITFLVFSTFSYPFSVLPLSILFIFLLALDTPISGKLSLTLPVWLQIVGVTVCWGITSYATYQILPKHATYQKWSSSQKIYNANAYTKAVNEYAVLHPKLKHEKNFLFEYGQSLSKSGQYAESNQIFKEYLQYGSDPMAYNCMGNNFKEMGEFSMAENLYLHASQIVPNRHYPVYLLMKLYMETGEAEKAKAMAETLLNKPVKVPSTAIREMQREAKQLIIKN